MTAVLDLPPLTVDRGSQDRRWRRIPARQSPDVEAAFLRTYDTLLDAAADRAGLGYCGVILLVRCDGNGTPLAVEGVQDQHPHGGAPRAARQWGRRYAVEVVEPVRDYSTHQVLEYLPVMQEVAQRTGEAWRDYLPPTGRRHGR